MEKKSQEIIQLCSHLFGETKRQVKKNNQSVDRLRYIFNELCQTPDVANRIYSDLLAHPDFRVRFEAASCCLELNHNVLQAKKVLREIARSNPDPVVQFSAEMVLDNSVS